jgi:hypothetical protein
MTKQVPCAGAAICLLVTSALFAQQTTRAPATPTPATGSSSTNTAAVQSGVDVNSDAKLMADFKAKVDDYVKLRKSLEKDVPPMKKTDNPEEIIRVERAIATKTRSARAQAKRGDFFTPATEPLFRRLINPVVKGTEGAETKAAIKDDAPEPAKIPFQVNGEYPKKEPLSTVPPDILKALPVLPEDIQYRFVGRHLILYDARPNIIVDFMLNALPAK